MLRKGIYRTISEHQTFEKHGGGTLVDAFHWFLCFYPADMVGLFGGSKLFFKPYLEDRIDLKGKITSLDGNRVEFKIFNKDADANLIFKGTIEGDRIDVTYYHENDPTNVFEDVFEYVDTGSEPH